jgi:hypothetical protein
MNKKFFLGITLILIAISAEGQITKKNWMVGGTGVFATDDQVINDINVKSISIDIFPRVGYFIIDKLALGSLFSFRYNTLKYIGVNSHSTSIGIGPFVRYYFLDTEKRINIFSEVN